VGSRHETTNNNHILSSVRNFEERRGRGRREANIKACIRAFCAHTHVIPTCMFFEELRSSVMCEKVRV
jgi:hypothetical protein